MRFRYLGDKDDMTAFGYSFAGGNEPDVTEPHALAKLSGNSHFEAVETVQEPELAVPLAAAEPTKKKGGRPRKVQPTEA